MIIDTSALVSILDQAAAFQGQRIFPDGHYDSVLLTSVPAGF